MSNKFQLVSAKKEDKSLLLSWRNEELTRFNSFNQKTITKKQHDSWFNKKIKEKKSIWIFKYNNKKCGMIRLEKKNNIIELGYLIKKNFRGKKLGKKMLVLFLKKYKKYAKSNIFLLAKSKKSNPKSNSSLIGAGFKEYKKNSNYSVFRFDF